MILPLVVWRQLTKHRKQVQISLVESNLFQGIKIPPYAVVSSRIAPTTYGGQKSGFGFVAVFGAGNEVGISKSFPAGYKGDFQLFICSHGNTRFSQIVVYHKNIFGRYRQNHPQYVFSSESVSRFFTFYFPTQKGHFLQGRTFPGTLPYSHHAG